MLEPLTPTRPRPQPIAAVLRARGLTITGMAQHVGCSATYLSQVCNGHRRPSSVLVNALARALDVDPIELFTAEADK